MDYNVDQLQLAERQVVRYQQRRSANYKPNIWKCDFLKSLSSKYDGEKYRKRAEKLRENVKVMFVEAVGELAKLELIDMISKLGLADLFAQEMHAALQAVASNSKNRRNNEEENLYITALRFRLLRQHGFEVSQDVFSAFLDEKGALPRGNYVDVKGLLQLFEASYLAFEGENILDEAKAFSKQTLIRAMHDHYNSTLDSNLAKEVAHALELSTHWRVQWFDVKWHINMYENNEKIDRILLELAKLNFNIIQATLQKDLSDLSGWWMNLGLMEHIDFTRDRLAESFLCTVGLAYEPHYSCFRKRLTKITTMILIIDDVYDIYGSLEELEQFTEAVDRWDAGKIQPLPVCVKICFEALSDITNEIAYDIQEHSGGNVDQALLHLSKAWAGFCRALFVEAKWYNEGYTPSLQEYLSNALISSSGTVISVHSMLSLMHELPDHEMINFLDKNQDLVCNVSIIIRLCNDLGTSMAEKERGDAPSSILCYMREENASEEKAEEHIKEMITSTWKKINGQCLISDQSPLLQSFVKVTANVARMVHCLYQFGDGFGIQDKGTRRHILSLLIQPFKLD